MIWTVEEPKEWLARMNIRNGHEHGTAGELSGKGADVYLSGCTEGLLGAWWRTGLLRRTPCSLGRDNRESWRSPKEQLGTAKADSSDYLEGSERRSIIQMGGGMRVYLPSLSLLGIQLSGISHKTDVCWSMPCGARPQQMGYLSTSWQLSRSLWPLKDQELSHPARWPPGSCEAGSRATEPHSSARLQFLCHCSHRNCNSNRGQNSPSCNHNFLRTAMLFLLLPKYRSKLIFTVWDLTLCYWICKHMKGNDWDSPWNVQPFIT